MPAHFLVETEDKKDGHDKDDGFIDDRQGKRSRQDFKCVRLGKALHLILGSITFFTNKFWVLEQILAPDNLILQLTI